MATMMRETIPEPETTGTTTFFFQPMEVVVEKGSHEADDDIARGQVKRFGSADELLKSLDAISANRPASK